MVEERLVGRRHYRRRSFDERKDASQDGSVGSIVRAIFLKIDLEAIYSTRSDWRAGHDGPQRLHRPYLCEAVSCLSLVAGADKLRGMDEMSTRCWDSWKRHVGSSLLPIAATTRVHPVAMRLGEQASNRVEGAAGAGLGTVSLVPRA